MRYGGQRCGPARESLLAALAAVGGGLLGALLGGLHLGGGEGLVRHALGIGVRFARL